MSKKSPFGAVITDKYRIIGVIGKGTYGIVHKAEKYGGRRKPQIIALKMVGNLLCFLLLSLAFFFTQIYKSFAFKKINQIRSNHREKIKMK